MSEDQAGGAEWEREEAWKLIAAARLTGAIEQEKIGWSRLDEARANALFSLVASLLNPLLLELRETRDDRKADVASNEHVTGLLLDQADIREADAGRQAALMGLAGVDIAQLHTQSDASDEAAGVLSDRIDIIEAAALLYAAAKADRIAHRALTKTIPALATQIADLTARVEALEARG